MTTWFDIVHYTLVGFGVCFTILLLILAWQGVVKLILMAYGNREQSTTTVHHTHTEEHHVHHLHHPAAHQPTQDRFETIFESTPSPSRSEMNHPQQVTQVRSAPKAITRSPVR